MRKILLLSLLMIVVIFTAKNSTAQEQKEGKANYSFGGHVFTGDFPITIGYAYLYEYKGLRIVDTAVIDTLGYYYFYSKPEGQYLVKAGLRFNDPNFGHFAFTYYPDATFWEDASIINLIKTYWEYDVHLYNIDPEQFENGPGRISGNIWSMDTKPFSQNIDVILCNERMEVIKHLPTNQLGEFSFENLNLGQYVLYPQVTGLTTQPISIQITEEQSQFDNIEITIEDGFIASFINEDIINSSSFMLYPNPSSDNLNIHFDVNKISHTITRIYDLSGRLVYNVTSTSSIGMNILQINTSEWQSGYYFCDIIIDRKSAIRQKFAVIH